MCDNALDLLTKPRSATDTRKHFIRASHGSARTDGEEESRMSKALDGARVTATRAGYTKENVQRPREQGVLGDAR